jgi:hypothetical protein
MVMTAGRAAAFVLPAAGSIVRRIWTQIRAASGGVTGRQVAGTSLVVGAGLGIDQIIDMVREDAPESDEQALRETAHTVARMLGLDGSEVLWPVHMRGDEKGQPIDPVYFTMNLSTGRAWYSSNYHSRKSVNAGFRRGQRSGRFRARRDAVQTKELSN